MNDIKVVELFAGVGGFRLGLEAASKRYKTVWANQWEPSMQEQYAFECYVKHFGKCDSYVCKDIAIAKENIPEHDLLVGGFPCQDYSIAKKNSKGIEGEKGVLWWQIDHILGTHHPSYVILENVDRLIRSPAKQCGRDFSIILRCFYEKGYAVEWRVINAADYGNAQRRRRIFIVAYHNDTKMFKELSVKICHNGIKAMHKHAMENGILCKAFPVTDHSMYFTDNWIDLLSYDSIQTLSREQKIQLYNTGVMINGRIYSVDLTPKCEPFIPLGKILEHKQLDERYFLRNEDMQHWRYAKGAKQETRRRRDGSTYLFTEGTVGFPDSLEKPSRTMLTSESKVGRSSHVVVDPMTKRLRVLTPVECERLNCFPDDWTNTGMPENMRYFCMGNALVVDIVTRIAKQIEKEISPKLILDTEIIRSITLKHF